MRQPVWLRLCKSIHVYHIPDYLSLLQYCGVTRLLFRQVNNKLSPHLQPTQKTNNLLMINIFSGQKKSVFFFSFLMFWALYFLLKSIFFVGFSVRDFKILIRKMSTRSLSKICLTIIVCYNSKLSQTLYWLVPTLQKTEHHMLWYLANRTPTFHVCIIRLGN